MTCSITYPSCHNDFITSQLGTSRPTPPEGGPMHAVCIWALGLKILLSASLYILKKYLDKTISVQSHVLMRGTLIKRKAQDEISNQGRGVSYVEFCRWRGIQPTQDWQLDPCRPLGEAAMCRESHTCEDQMELWVASIHLSRVVTLPNWSCDWIFTHLNSMHGTPFSIFWKGSCVMFSIWVSRS